MLELYHLSAFPKFICSGFFYQSNGYWNTVILGSGKRRKIMFWSELKIIRLKKKIKEKKKQRISRTK